MKTFVIHKKGVRGFTLIELIMLILIAGILGNTLLITLSTATRNTPIIMQSAIAGQTAQRCMEWFIGQVRKGGYSAITCPNVVTPAFCTSAAGYTVGVNVQFQTISGDATYKAITITVTGTGMAQLTSLVGSY